MKLDAATASRMAGIALGHVTREYPNKLDHVLLDGGDALPPRTLHPIFYGSFDWHSCVHGWWTLLTLRRLFPRVSEAAAIATLADDSFTPDKITVGLGYFTCTSNQRVTLSNGLRIWSRSLGPSLAGCANICRS
jgi:hypothetical protein